MKKVLLTGAVLITACTGQGGEKAVRGSVSPPTTRSARDLIVAGVWEGHDRGPDVEEATTTTTEPGPSTTTTEAPVPTTRVRAVTTTTRYLREQTTGQSSSTLASIRACESGGNYSTDTGNGYYGAYQFHPQTWQSVGGTGNPAHASPAEQDMRAQMMINAGRRGEWPNC